jgi:hypothetical protein
MKASVLALGGLALSLSACASVAPAPSAQLAAAERSAEAFQRDRAAILAMAGEFDVTFDFRETVALAEGYEFAEPKRTGAWEVVRVIEDEGDFIALQHLLLVGDEDAPMVIKHWRQDWEYEPDRMMAYRGHDEWAMLDLAETETAGAWSQSVYQVDDSPRYAGLARWTHDAAISTWTPEASWRPLPRRDDTTRSDYHAISAVNRHVVTPEGWVHEQDNTKMVVPVDGAAPYALVREVGVNTYRYGDLPRDDAADEYWANTAAYWARVRDFYDALEANSAGFRVEDDSEGELLYGPMLSASMRLHFGAEDLDGAWAEAQDLLSSQVTAR